MKKILLTAVALSAITMPAMAETRDILSYDKAAACIHSCVEVAKENGWNVSIVTLDRGDNNLASARMTNALSASYTGAKLKASSSLAWGMPTDKIEGFISDKPAFRAFSGLLTIAGGMPAMSKTETLIGGIGVAGSSPNNDTSCAASAAKVIMK